MEKSRSLAHRLRLSAVSDEAAELLAEVTARLITANWLNSRAVDLKPCLSSVCFNLYVNSAKVASLSYGGLDRSGMKPCVIVESGNDCEGYTDAESATDRLSELIKKSLTTKDGQASDNRKGVKNAPL